MNIKENKRDVVLSVRTTSAVRDGLRELAVLFGEELGTKVSQSQVLDMLIMDALHDRIVSDE